MVGVRVFSILSRKIISLVAAIGVGFAMGGPAFAAEALVKDIRFGVSSPTVSRVVVDISEPVIFKAGQDTAGESLSFKLAGARLGPRPQPEKQVAGLVESYSAREVGQGDILVEVKLKKYCKIKELFSIPPSATNHNFRVVMDVEETGPTKKVASAKNFQTLSDVISASTQEGTPRGRSSQARPATGTSSASLSVRPAGDEMPVVVIDAGHGGSDPGALGPDGVREADVTLAAALALKDALVRLGGYKVVLTRSKDERVAYEERTQIARGAQAGLFISLHADSISNSKVRGASIYTLSKTGSERSAREALSQEDYKVFGADLEKENPVVGGILYSKAQEWTGTESDRFAQALISKLAGVTPLLNNTHRKGNLIVLLSPDVPAVLLELAFISNAKDETNLKSPAWRKRTMGAVANAIDDYFTERALSRQAFNEASTANR